MHGGSEIQTIQARVEWGTGSTGKGGLGYRQYRQGGSGVQAVQARVEWGTGSTGKGGVG